VISSVSVKISVCFGDVLLSGIPKLVVYRHRRGACEAHSRLPPPGPVVRERGLFKSYT
jgi:hypothetical protein